MLGFAMFPGEIFGINIIDKSMMKLNDTEIACKRKTDIDIRIGKI